jgi:hypothetical protein
MDGVFLYLLKAVPDHKLHSLNLATRFLTNELSQGDDEMGLWAGWAATIEPPAPCQHLCAPAARKNLHTALTMSSTLTVPGSFLHVGYL